MHAAIIHHGPRFVMSCMYVIIYIYMLMRLAHVTLQREKADGRTRSHLQNKFASQSTRQVHQGSFLEFPAERVAAKLLILLWVSALLSPWAQERQALAAHSQLWAAAHLRKIASYSAAYLLIDCRTKALHYCQPYLCVTQWKHFRDATLTVRDAHLLRGCKIQQ